MELVFAIVVVSIGIIGSIIAFMSPDNNGFADRLRSALGGFIGGGLATIGCAMRIAMALIPILIFIFLIVTIFRSCV